MEAIEPKIKRSKAGILRVDVSKYKPEAVEVTFVPQGEAHSPQLSVDRVSVTFADEFFGSRSNQNRLSPMDNMQLPTEAAVADSDEEDYSASVSAIIQRRASTRRSRRRSSRRTSSPFTPDVLPSAGNERRRSSIYTTSSGDTAITIEDTVRPASQDQIFENIKVHKEVLQNVKMQPWDMRKKLKLVMQARAYIKKHEGALQERLAQSGSTKDRLARCYIYLFKKWRKFRRELSNTSNWFIPWEQKIKEIESHFGSVVASYFLFLRWLFWVNIVIAVGLVCFVAIPELSTANPKEAGDRKVILPEEKYSSTNFLTLWDFKGYFEVSPLFYGWYTNNDTNKKRYRLPLAYFMTGLVVYAYSFFATLRKMAENSRMSKLSEKDDECIFSWKLFTAWDYMIGNCEAAHNRVASIIMGFKEALLEEAEKKRESRNWKITTLRIMVNIVIMGLFSLSVGTVAFLVKRSIMKEGQTTFWRRNELTIVMTLISLVFPMLFDAMGFFEQYHPRKQLRIQLGRIMALNLLNLYSLIISQFDKIYDISDEMTKYFNDLTSQNKKDQFEERPVLPPGKNIYCFQRCYWNKSTTSNPILMAALILNSSITQPGNIISPNNISMDLKIIDPTHSSNVSQFNSSLKGGAIDYLNYEDYFAPDGKNTSESSTMDSLETIDLEEETYFNITTRNTSEEYDEAFNHSLKPPEILEVNWKGKFIDYLTYILSKFGDEDTVLNSTDGYEAFNTSTDVTLEESSTTEATTYKEDWKTLSDSSTEKQFPETSTRIIVSSTTTGRTTEEQLKEASTNIITSSTSYDTSTSDDYDDHKVTKESSTISNRYTTSHSPSTTTPEETLSCENSMVLDPSQRVCEWICEEEEPINMTAVGHLIQKMNNSDRLTLRALCWETMFGQELVKLTIMDLIMTFLSTMALDFFRGIFVRVMNSCWCWDLEKSFPKYSDFKVAENILHLVNNQGMIWMGLFFSPGLAVINVVKLFILMYLRAWTVLTCNVPPQVIFRASKSNNFYYALLLMMLFLCVLPVGYAIVWVEPSWYCGPFSGYKRIYHIFTQTITKNAPPPFDKALEYIASPGSIIPLLVLLILFIYYLTSLTSSLREANAELKLQLRRERTEERRKMFQMVERRRRVGSSGSDPNNPFHKWKKLLGNLPAGKSEEEHLESLDQSQQNSGSAKESKDFFARLIKKALRKSSTSEDANQIQDDASDLEQIDSLPHEVNKINNPDSEATSPKKRRISSSSGSFRKLVAAISSNKTIKENEDNPKNIDKSTDAGTEDESNTKRTRKRSSGNEDSISTTCDIKRQESVSSNWSDNIPVIKISKTESTECILEQNSPNNKEKETKKKQSITKTNETISSSSTGEVKQKFTPRVKYDLKKQTTEIDEDTILHFHKDVMKQRSETLVHESYWKEDSQERPESGEKDSKDDSTSKINDDSRAKFESDSSNEGKDSVFY